MKNARRLLAGFVALALSIAIPASISAAWFTYLLWILIGVAVAALIVFSQPVQRQIPWRIERRDPEFQRAVILMVAAYSLRKDLQVALQTVRDMNDPSIGELRAFADNLAERLRNEGYRAMATRVEVHLPDNATQGVINGRKDQIRDELIKALIWDNYN